MDGFSENPKNKKLEKQNKHQIKTRNSYRKKVPFHAPKKVPEFYAFVDDELVSVELDGLVDEGREGGRQGDLALEHGVAALDSQRLGAERESGATTSSSASH